MLIQLAPMSWFNMVAHDPPTVMLSVQCKPGSKMKGLPLPSVLT